MREIRILLVGGGSGGHIYPLVAVAQSLREKASAQDINLKLMMMGDSVFLERAAKDLNIPFKILFTGKLKRDSAIQALVDLFKIPFGLLQSFIHIFIFMPDAVFVKGSYASVPPAIVARLFFIPVYLHETDSIPGLANAMIGKISNTVFLAYKMAEKHFEGANIIYTGNPVRKSLLNGNKDEARKFFDLPESRPTILVLGGSQGAKAINDAIVSSLVVMTQKYNVIHHCGDSQIDIVKRDVDTIIKEGTQQYSTPIKVYYRMYAFLDEKQLAMAYALADIIITRAGGALFEIAMLGKPAIVVPITQSASNHQYFNAFEFSLFGGYLMEESNLNRETIVHEIERLLNPEAYAKISAKLKTFSVPNSADIIAEELLKS